MTLPLCTLWESATWLVRVLFEFLLLLAIGILIYSDTSYPFVAPGQRRR